MPCFSTNQNHISSVRKPQKFRICGTMPTNGRANGKSGWPMFIRRNVKFESTKKLVVHAFKAVSQTITHKKVVRIN